MKTRNTLSFVVFILAGMLVLSSCGRDKMIRVRLLAPIADKTEKTSVITYKGTNTTEKDSATPTSTGSSLYVSFKGLGIGTSSTTTEFDTRTHLDNNSTPLVSELTTLTATFTELAFSFGDQFTTTFGLGKVASGSLGAKVDYGSDFSTSTDETVSSSSVGGTSRFLMFGHHANGFETLLGMRWNTLSVKLDLAGTSAETLKAADSINISDTPIEIKTVQTMLGFGFSF